MTYTTGIHTIPIEQLNLDPKNPRLPERLKDAAEETVLNWMLTDATLTDLMASIVENGFFSGEAIVGIHAEGGGNQIVVVEGNRRVASVKLLNRPAIAEQKSKTVHELHIEGTAKNTIPTELPVYIVNSRDQVANYLGFRHISGVKQWPVIAKARYVTSLLAAKPWSPDIYRQLAKEIGSKSSYVRRLVVGYKMFQEIEQRNFFDVDYLTEENFDLSLINDAATKYGDIASFMRVYPDNQEPLAEVDMENFRKVFDWLYKRDGKGQTRVGESRNLPVLNKILGTEAARVAFVEQNYSLNDAAALTTLSDENVRYHLQNARVSMLEAQKLAHTIQAPSRTDVRLTEEIRGSADLIRRAMLEKLNSDTDSIL